MTLRRLRPAAPGVLVATSRRDATNTVVVLAAGGPAGRTGHALLIDPAWTPDELDGLAADLVTLAPRSVTGFSTHAHFDHLLWHHGFGAGPRLAGRTTSARARADRAALLDELGPGYPVSALAGTPRIHPVANAVPWSGPEVALLESGAHERGHTTLWFPRERLLVAGDLLSDVEVPLLEASDPTGAAYRSGLETLAPFAHRARLVVPGHGRPTSHGGARLAADLAYLDALGAGRMPADARLRDVTARRVWEQQSAALAR